MKSPTPLSKEMSKYYFTSGSKNIDLEKIIYLKQLNNIVALHIKLSYNLYNLLVNNIIWIRMTKYIKAQRGS